MLKSRTVRLDDRGDQDAEPGSRPWAIHVRGELHACLSDFEEDHRRLEVLLTSMRARQGWARLEDAAGKAFQSFEAFCVERRPFGLGYKPEAIDQIVAERKARTAEQRATRARANTLLDNAGPPTKEEKEERESNLVVNKITGGSTNADYLTARIARDAPEVLERMRAGEFRSVRQAAITAGIVKVPTPYEVAVRVVKKLSADDWRKLKALMDDGGQ
jgi:hypothetical protein